MLDAQQKQITATSSFPLLLDFPVLVSIFPHPSQ